MRLMKVFMTVGVSVRLYLFVEYVGPDSFHRDLKNLRVSG